MADFKEEMCKVYWNYDTGEAEVKFLKTFKAANRTIKLDMLDDVRAIMRKEYYDTPF